MKSLIRNELARVYHKKIIHILFLIQMLIFIYSYYSNDMVFKSEKYYLTNSYNINLIVMYLFSSIFVTIMFSKEKEEGFDIINLTSPFPRQHILISKILSLMMLFILLNIFHIILYAGISLILGYQTINNTLIMNMVFQFINILPLMCFSLVLILFDIVVDNSTLTVVFSFMLFISVGIIPVDISKYFITYYTNLAATIFHFEEFNTFNIVILLFTYLMSTFPLIYVIYMKKEY